jgi:glutaredoxin-like protein
MTAMIDDKIKKQVLEVFSGLKEPVEVLFFGSDDNERCQYCGETRQLLEEVTALSDLFTLSVYDLERDAEMAAQFKVDSVPEFVMVGREGERRIDYGIRYKGIPAGHEFSSLINDLLIVSQRKSSLTEETRAFLGTLTEPVHMQVFVTPTCPYCPRAVILAHQMALESPLVEAEMVEATEFPELAERFGVSGVPQTTINMGAGMVVGAVPEKLLVEEIQNALRNRVHAEEKN